MVGGSTWNRAIRLSTNDGGLTWQNDSLFDKQIFGLGYNNRGKVFGLGIEYMVYEFLQQSTSRQRIGDYRFLEAWTLLNLIVSLRWAENHLDSGILKK